MCTMCARNSNLDPGFLYNSNETFEQQDIVSLAVNTLNSVDCGNNRLSKTTGEIVSYVHPLEFFLVLFSDRDFLLAKVVDAEPLSFVRLKCRQILERTAF